MMLLSNFHFIRSLWLFAIIPSFIFLFLLRRARGDGNSWKKVIEPHLLPYLLIKQENTYAFWPLLLAGVIGFLAIFSLAGPTWLRLLQPVYRVKEAKIILLDLSPSMLAQDISPNRLTRAKYKIDDILNQYREGQTGLAVFSNESYTVAPLTNDAKTIAAMVPVLSPTIMPVSGSSIAAGLQQAEKLLVQGGENRGSILLLTDSKPTEQDNKIAKKIHRDGYTLSVLGVGTRLGAPIPNGSDGFFNIQGKTVIAKLDIAGLKKLAESGGGRFSLFTNNNSDIKTLLESAMHDQHQHLTTLKNSKEKATTELWKDEGHWFVLLLLPFVLILFRRGWMEELCK